jgi:CRISPR/Cas system-associated endonuclease Cas3-HD
MPELTRAEKRKQRKQKLHSIIEDAKTLPDLDGHDDVDKVEAEFKKCWNLIKSILEWAISLAITGKKLDNALKDVIVLGDQAADNRDDEEANRKFVQNVNKYWPTVKFALNAAMAIWDRDDYDKYIEKAMKIGDIITQNDQD